MLTTTPFARGAVPYTSMFLVESTITQEDVWKRELEERMAYMNLVVKLTLNRKDQWPSKEHALNYFSKRLPWNLWDSRALESFVVCMVLLSSGQFECS
jgi:hypothetical protein